MAADARLSAERAARADLRGAVEDLQELEVRAGLRRRSRLDRAVIAVAAVAALGAMSSVVLWIGAARSYTDDDFRQAAATRVGVLLSPDHRRPDQARRILDGATGEFRDEFAQSADAYSRFVASQGTVGSGHVDGTGVADRRGDRASVVVAASIAFTADEVAGTGAVADTVRRFRLRVVVEPDDGVLKLAAVQSLP